MSMEQDLQELPPDLPAETDEEVFTLPPEALAEAAAAAPSAPATGLTRERLDELNANPDLATEVELPLLNDYVLNGRPWPEAAAPATETAEEVAAREALEAETPDPAAAAAAAPETPAAEEEEEDDTALHRSTLDAVTALRTKHKTEMDRLNAIIKAPEPEDEYSDEHKAWAKNRTAALIEKSDLQDTFQHDFAEATLAAQAQTVATREAERFMGGFDKAAAKHAEVKLDRPFKVANAAYDAWLKSLVAKSGITEGTEQEKLEAAYTKYQSDPAFAATVPPPKDLAQVQRLNKARMLVEQAGGKRSLDGAVLEVLATEGLLDKRVGTARTEASQASAANVQKALQRAPAAPLTAPLGGPAKAPKVLAVPVDPETASAYLTNLLNKQAKNLPLTPFETRHEDAAKALIGLDKVR